MGWNKTSALPIEVVRYFEDKANDELDTSRHPDARERQESHEKLMSAVAGPMLRDDAYASTN